MPMLEQQVHAQDSVIGLNRGEKGQTSVGCPGASRSRIRKAMTFGALVAGLAAVAAPNAAATSESNSLDLKGGDKLESNAFHCGVYLNSCSWSSSAKLIGSTPDRASWIQNNAEVRAHGPSAKITIAGKNSNVEITFKSSSLLKTKWRNTKTWISDSSGKVSPSKSVIYVSTKSKAYASHPAFGKPGPVVAYAGAI
jgi:hypothetical protein